ITRVLVPVIETAAKSPSSGDQQTDTQLLLEAPVRVVQVSPSGEVRTHEVSPVIATATKSLLSGDQQIDVTPEIGNSSATQPVPAAKEIPSSEKEERSSSRTIANLPISGAQAIPLATVAN